jgi:hypothetical protein
VLVILALVLIFRPAPHFDAGPAERRAPPVADKADP